MRLAGRITEWNDDKGFGFVVPNGGGERTFVHVNDFQRGSRRPVAGDLISWEPATDARGRPKARQVRHAGQRIAVPRQPSHLPRAAMGLVALAVVAAAALPGWLPPALAAGYFVVSGVTWLMYRRDKAAAGGNDRRTPESSLHLASLLGGWPGALVAQQQFRHKTIKQPFQVVFWVTVMLNVGAVAWAVQAGLLG